MARKHIPVSIPIEGGGHCIAHVDPDASPELMASLKNLAKAAANHLREEARLEKEVLDNAIDLLADYEMERMPDDGVGSYGRLLKAARALRDLRYRRPRAPSEPSGEDPK